MQPSTTKFGHRSGVRFAMAAAALGFAMVLPSTAFAAAPVTWSTTSQFQYGNGYCGADHPELPVLGDLAITGKGKSVSLHVMLDGTPATADSSYTLYLFDGSCNQLDVLKPFTTNGFGVADITFDHLKTHGATTFFASLDGPNGWNDTTVFSSN